MRAERRFVVVTAYPFAPLDRHPNQMTVQEFRLAVEDTVRLLLNRPDCPPRPPPRLIWIGTPSYPPRRFDPKPIVDPPVEGTWYEARSTPRLTRFHEAAAEVVRAAGGAVIDMGALSQPVVGAMVFDHMDATDGLIALAAEIHDKIAPWLDA